MWTNKIIFLTGASSGIGNALAIELAKRGAILGLLARRKEELEKLRAECEKLGAIARIFPADVADKESLFQAAETLRNEFGKIDILIANAGIGGGAVHASKLDADVFKKVIDVNLIGTANSVAAVLPDMFAKKNGQLVAISSLAAYGGLPKSASYNASKAGMSAMFESLRLDLLNSGVDVTIVHPGFIKTPLTSGREANMPFLMELDDAVQTIIRGIEKRKKNVAFPFPLAHFVRLARFFPLALYDFIAARNSYRE